MYTYIIWLFTCWPGCTGMRERRYVGWNYWM